MSKHKLEGLRVAILATDLFEEAELVEPRKALQEAGARTFVIAPKSGEIQAVQHDQKTQKVKVDMTLDQAKPEEFDALLLPGGAMNADALRMEKKAQEFVKAIDREGKPIAVICHGPVVAGFGRAGEGTAYDQLLHHSRRPEECRRHLEGRGEPARSQLGQQPPALRPAAV